MSDADVKMPEPDPALKDVALLLNQLILMSSAKAQQEPGEPPQDRITDADIDGLEADVLEAVRAAVLAERERCAKLADEYATWGGSNFAEWFRKCAAAIREGTP